MKEKQLSLNVVKEASSNQTPPRPKYHDHTIAEVVAKRLVKPILDWMEHDAANQKESEIVEDLVSVIDDYCNKDGFEIARDLERYCQWSCDSMLVEILDQVSSYWSEEHKARVKEWARYNQVTLSLPVGAKVIVSRPDQIGELKEPREGFIHTRHEDEARYTIRIPSLGHVEKGLGTHGIIFDKEEVEK